MKIMFPVAVGSMLLGAAYGSGGAAQSPKPACSDPINHQFDFWIGHWEVTANGKAAGTSHIEQILNGYALLENWSSAQGGAGKSLNFFDPADGLWHQTWVDQSGSVLYLAGGFKQGAMRLEGNRPASKQQPAIRHRITWTPLAGGQVRQLWESSPVDKDVWSVQFDGLYVPAR
ncbi:MAG TPA: hypothetical protein VKB34_23545 [Povalibacter sp.]|nr:hypothetical protein [Povalibacter sp.]